MASWPRYPSDCPLYLYCPRPCFLPFLTSSPYFFNLILARHDPHGILSHDTINDGAELPKGLTYIIKMLPVVLEFLVLEV